MTTWDEWAEMETLSEQSATIFSASNEDEEPWRLSRLKEVYETAQQVCMVVYRRPFPHDAVLRMFDCKGALTVQFADDDWEMQLASIFELAWSGVFECEFKSTSEPDGMDTLSGLNPVGRA